ncbi:UNVERIFIED_ORG: hypothetical protein B2H93_14745 [Clostridium botulinum]
MNREKINKLIINIINGVTWEQAFNAMDREYSDLMIDILAEQEIEQYELLNNITIQSYNIQYELSNLDLEQEIELLSESVSKIYDKQLDTMKIALKFQDKNKESTKILAYKIKEWTGDKLLDRLKIYLNENIDVNKLHRRIESFAQKLIQISTSLSKFNANGFIVLNENFDNIFKIKDFCYTQNRLELKKLELELKNLISANKKEQYLKIFDYKEMIKKAKSEGYKEDRFNGDHMVLVHKDTNKIVVIPQHELGFGLMKVIQQQIKENKVA